MLGCSQPRSVAYLIIYLILELLEGYCSKPSTVTNVNLLACTKMQRCKDTDSIKTLIHALVMSRVDYCNTVLAGSPTHIFTDKLHCVLNSAARLVTGTCKFNHGLSHLLHKELHWLDVPESIHSVFMLPPLTSISLHLQW